MANKKPTPRKKAATNMQTGIPKGKAREDMKKKVKHSIARYAHLGGAPRLFKEPSDLLNAFINYINWNRDNPMKEERLVTRKGVPVTRSLSKLRVPTITGFCVYCGYGESWFRNMKSADFKEREKFGAVLEIIESTIKQEQIEGASADMLNANIISRLQGLKEHVDHTTDDKAIPTPPPLQVFNTAPPFASDEKDLDLKKPKK